MDARPGATEPDIPVNTASSVCLGDLCFRQNHEIGVREKIEWRGAGGLKLMRNGQSQQ